MLAHRNFKARPLAECVEQCLTLFHELFSSTLDRAGLGHHPTDVLGTKKVRQAQGAGRWLIEPDHTELSIRRQCELVGLPCSQYYYAPAAETPESLALMRLIDEQYLRTASFGSRQMTHWPQRQGHRVKRKRIQ